MKKTLPRSSESRSRKRPRRPRQMTFDDAMPQRRPTVRQRLRAKSSAMPHRKREAFRDGEAMLVTMKAGPWCPTLRSDPAREAIEAAFVRVLERKREGFGVVVYSIQSDHVHMVVEGADRASVANALRAFAISAAKRLNRVWGRKGRVFRDRYHDRILRTPREVRNAIAYVLLNSRKHGSFFPDAIGECDPCSSGPWFEGWNGYEPSPELRAHRKRPVVEPRTWLLAEGWLRHGRIGLHELPGGRKARRNASPAVLVIPLRR